MIEWHRLLGLGLTDCFTDSGYEVRMEIDLSIKKQLLDILIIERESVKPLSELPDGLENLAQYNLISYKSFRQVADAWSLDELNAHYVNYRKQISPSLDKLLAVENFRLYLVCTRRPEKLTSEATLQFVKLGVYDIQWGGKQIRLIVLSEVPKVKRNALWLLFSGIMESVQFGLAQYEWRQPELSSVMNDLFKFYRIEGLPMPYTVEDYKRDHKREVLASMTPEERLEGLPPEERLKGLPLEEFLKRLPPEERLKGLPPEEFLKRLSREDIEAYLKKLTAAN